MVAGFCKDSAGFNLIQRGDYRILGSKDEKFINPEDIAAVLRPGMKVEMSIILFEVEQRKETYKAYNCPRCTHVNKRIVTLSGWSDW